MGKCILITEAKRSRAQLDRRLPRDNRAAVCRRSPAHRLQLKHQAARHWTSEWLWSWIWKSVFGGGDPHTNTGMGQRGRDAKIHEECFRRRAIRVSRQPIKSRTTLFNVGARKIVPVAGITRCRMSKAKTWL